MNGRADAVYRNPVDAIVALLRETVERGGQQVHVYSVMPAVSPETIEAVRAQRPMAAPPAATPSKRGSFLLDDDRTLGIIDADGRALFLGVEDVRRLAAFLEGTRAVWEAA